LSLLLFLEVTQRDGKVLQKVVIAILTGFAIRTRKGALIFVGSPCLNILINIVRTLPFLTLLASRFIKNWVVVLDR